MGLDNLEALVEILLHRLVVDQVLFELLGELGAEHLKIVDLLGGLSAHFHNFLIDVSAQEVCSLGRVLACVLDLFQDLLDRDFLAFLELADLGHHVFEHVADQHLGVLVALHPLIDLDLDHFADFVSNLQLLASESVDLIANTVSHFRKFRSDVDFLLCSCKLFLPQPAVDASDLSVKVGRDLLYVGFFALQFLPDGLVDLVLAISQLVQTVASFLACHFVLHLYLVADFLNLARSLVLL